MNNPQHRMYKSVIDACLHTEENKLPRRTHDTHVSTIGTKVNHSGTMIHDPRTKMNYPDTTMNHYANNIKHPSTKHLCFKVNHHGTKVNHPDATMNNSVTNHPETKINRPYATVNHTVTYHSCRINNPDTKINYPDTSTYIMDTKVCQPTFHKVKPHEGAYFHHIGTRKDLPQSWNRSYPSSDQVIFPGYITEIIGCKRKRSVEVSETPVLKRHCSELGTTVDDVSSYIRHYHTFHETRENRGLVV